jgi:hypothetical protein
VNRISGLFAVPLLAASSHGAFASAGTLHAPNPYWLSLALAMALVAGGIYLRARIGGRPSRTLAADLSV